MILTKQTTTVRRRRKKRWLHHTASHQMESTRSNPNIHQAIDYKQHEKMTSTINHTKSSIMQEEPRDSLASHSQSQLVTSVHKALKLCTLVAITFLILLSVSQTKTCQAAPGTLNFVAKMASSVASSSSSASTASPLFLDDAAAAAVQSTHSSNLVKSARLVAYSLSCPPAASIHPCTCIHHLPGAQIESEEEEGEIFVEISPAITTPYAEPLVMTTTTTPTPQTTTTTTTTRKQETEATPVKATTPTTTTQTPASTTSIPTTEAARVTSTEASTTTPAKVGATDKVNVSESQPPARTIRPTTETIASLSEDESTTRTAPTQVPYTSTTSELKATTEASYQSKSVRPTAATQPSDSTPTTTTTTILQTDVVQDGTQTASSIAARDSRPSQVASATPGITTLAPQIQVQPRVDSQRELLPLANKVTNAAQVSTSTNSSGSPEKQPAEQRPEQQPELLVGNSNESRNDAIVLLNSSSGPGTEQQNTAGAATSRVPNPASSATADQKSHAQSADLTSSAGIGGASPATVKVDELAAKLQATSDLSKGSTSALETRPIGQKETGLSESGGKQESLPSSSPAGLATQLQANDSNSQLTTATNEQTVTPQPLIVDPTRSSPSDFPPKLTPSSAATISTEARPEHSIAQTGTTTSGSSRTTPMPLPASSTQASGEVSSSTLAAASSAAGGGRVTNDSAAASEQPTLDGINMKAQAGEPIQTSKNESGSAGHSASTSTTVGLEATTAPTRSTQAEVSSAAPTPGPTVHIEQAGQNQIHLNASSQAPCDQSSQQATAAAPNGTSTTILNVVPTKSTIEKSSKAANEIDDERKPSIGPSATNTTNGKSHLGGVQGEKFQTSDDVPQSVVIVGHALSSTTTTTTSMTTQSATITTEAPAASSLSPTATTATATATTTTTTSTTTTTRAPRATSVHEQPTSIVVDDAHPQNAAPKLVEMSSGVPDANQIDHNTAGLAALKPQTISLVAGNSSQIGTNLQGNQTIHRLANNAAHRVNATTATSLNGTQSSRPASVGRAIHSVRLNNHPSNSSRGRHQSSQAIGGRQILTPNTHNRQKPSLPATHHANSSTTSYINNNNNNNSTHHVSNSQPARAQQVRPPPSRLSRSTRAVPSAQQHLQRPKKLQHQRLTPKTRLRAGHQASTTLAPRHTLELTTSELASSQRSPNGRRLTRFLAQNVHEGNLLMDPFADTNSEQQQVEVVAYCRNIQNPAVLSAAIKGFRGHQISYFVIDSCKVPAFPNDLFHGVDVRWLEMTNSSVQFHNNFLQGHHHHHHHPH